MSYTHDNANVAFIGIERAPDRKEYFKNYNAVRRARYAHRKRLGKLAKYVKYTPVARDKRKDHRPSANDSDQLCPVHNTPLKRYTTNRNRFAGFGPDGERLTKCNEYFRCNHCKWAGLPCYYPGKIIIQVSLVNTSE